MATQLPAVVTIQDLPTGTTLTGAELLEAVQTSGGVVNTVQITVGQIMTTGLGGLPVAGATGQFLQKASATSFATQWANISSNVLASTGLAQAGSTTVSLSLASTAGLSVLGVGGTGSAVPSAIAGTGAQTLVVNDAGNALAFGALNLGSAAAVTGVLPTTNGGLGTTTGGANTVLAANGGAPAFSSTPSLGQLTISPPASSLSTGFSVGQSLAGTFTTANVNLNTINISSDNANFSANFGVGLEVNYSFGGSSMQGGREAIQGNASLATTSSSSNLNRNYVGITGVGAAVTNDNGTGVTATTAAGAIFGGNFVGALSSTGATGLLNVSGAEFNTFVGTSASVYAKTLAQFSADARDRVQGSGVDAMLWLYNQSTSNPGWNNGILFDGSNQPWPISSTGTIIKSLGAASAAVGIDFSATSFSTAAFRSQNFTVDNLGNITGGGFSRLASNFSTATTTLGPIGTLVCSMATGGGYKFEAVLFCTAGSTGGTQIEITATAPLTSIIYDMQAYAGGSLVAQARATTIAALNVASATTPTIRIVGFAQCGATACNLLPVIAQISATTTVTQALAGSFFEVFRMS